MGRGRASVKVAYRHWCGRRAMKGVIHHEQGSPQTMPARPFCRYAIYYTPAPGPLAQFGAAWLGHDIASGTPMAHSQGIEGLPAPIAELSKAPRRYGFHATIKPPFRLSPGASQEALIRAVEQFCADQPPVTLDGA